MEKRHILLIVALFSTIVFVLPNIYSVFAGQHWFYDTGVSYCLKCHSDIKQELDTSSSHQYFTCENCHALNTISSINHGNVANPRCMDCHGTPPRIVVDSMNQTFLSSVAKIFGENITNKESHNSFIRGANMNPLMKGENEACITCHTFKSVSIKMFYAGTYGFYAKRLIDSTWTLTGSTKKTELPGPFLIQSNESSGKHSFPAISQLRCEKCHPDIRDDLNSSSHHTYFTCKSCHQLYSEYHSSSVPPCLSCHGTNPLTVVDQKGSTFTAKTAPVYSTDISAADAHMPFFTSASNTNSSEGSNIICNACHSDFNTNINYARPNYVEWDVVKSGNAWVIQNLSIGPMIDVSVTNSLGGKLHNLSMISDINCVSCHEDIETAVISGGHSNEQWRHKHNYGDYSDMNSYCRSCHKPITEDKSGNSPYPAYPFNSQIHGAMKISCMDCHGRSSDLFVYLNQLKEKPIYSGGSMGNIEDSIMQQPAFVQSYICMACKNTGNPSPLPQNPLHFKLYTEPQIAIYINEVQGYP